MYNMKISLCMIVKNEEESLSRILDCTKKFVDEIIICDTGSSDKTLDIAKRYTDKIYHFKWVNDFSLARNYCFSKANFEYIIWLDADDYITDDNIEKILKLKRETTKPNDIYMFKYAISFDKMGKSTFSYYRERIIKNSSEYYWQGFIHEAIELKGSVEYCDIEIEHRKIKESPPNRNLKIYYYHIKNGVKLSTRLQYYYLKELYYNGKFKKCITETYKYFKMENKFMPNYIDAILTLSFCYYKKSKEKSLQILLENLIYISPTSEYFCQIALLLKELGNTEMAIQFYKSSLNTEPKYDQGYFVQTRYYYYVPLIELSVLLYYSDYESAYHFHNILKSQYSTDKYVLNNDKFFKK